jgi:2-polyprenyl-3-methyl-5-hydroxy-6-metoxy-1,4-benzoquinol methylase
VDAVFSLEVLEHIPQPERALQEMMRVTRKYVLISVPNEPVFRIQRLLSGKGLRMWGDHPEHVNHWSFWGIQRFLAANGLHIITARTPPPFAWSVVLCATV